MKGLEDSGFWDHMIANSNSDCCAGLASGHHGAVNVLKIRIGLLVELKIEA
ncbi:hypothetical protein N9D84_01355 [Planktomarina temperata]|nr:hypothetical protein [Planktomarina temperata]MDB0018948.1 hypothetical protein [Planktomarina temperata]